MQLSPQWSHHLSVAGRVRPLPSHDSPDLLTSQAQREQTQEVDFHESLLPWKSRSAAPVQCDTSNLLQVTFMQNIMVILSYNECRNTKQRGKCNKNRRIETNQRTVVVCRPATSNSCLKFTQSSTMEQHKLFDFTSSIISVKVKPQMLHKMPNYDTRV